MLAAEVLRDDAADGLQRSDHVDAEDGVGGRPAARGRRAHGLAASVRFCEPLRESHRRLRPARTACDHSTHATRQPSSRAPRGRASANQVTAGRQRHARWKPTTVQYRCRSESSFRFVPFRSVPRNYVPFRLGSSVPTRPRTVPCHFLGQTRPFQPLRFVCAGLGDVVLVRIEARRRRRQGPRPPSPVTTWSQESTRRGSPTWRPLRFQLPFRFRSFNSSEFRSFRSVPLKTGRFRGIARLWCVGGSISGPTPCTRREPPRTLTVH